MQPLGRNSSLGRNKPNPAHRLLPEVKEFSDHIRVYYSPSFIQRPELFDQLHSKLAPTSKSQSLSSAGISPKLGPLPRFKRLPILPPVKQGLAQSVASLGSGQSGAYLSGIMKKFELPHRRKYRCFVGAGNVDAVIRVLKNRDCWQFMENIYDPAVNLIWKQTTAGINFHVYSNQSAENLKALNHFEFHMAVSQKDKLLRNFAKYCVQHELQVFDFLPPSFEVKIDSKHLNGSKEGFRCLFELVQDSGEPDGEVDLEASIDRLASAGRLKPAEAKAKLAALFEGTTELKRIPATFNRGANIWLVKPNDCNRGTGIELLRSAADFPRIVQSIEAKVRQVKGLASAPRRLLVQKYMEAPMLLAGRKFDIRMWVLLDALLHVYIFPEGYLRLSGEPFSLSDGSMFVHLTNNAVQQHAATYGKFERGNQLSFEAFREQARREGAALDWQGTVYPRILKLTKMAFASVGFELNQNRRENCFELFGIDLMLDCEGVAWLIEVNTNPCLELSSPLLEQLIPRMLDDALELTLDFIFPPPLPRKEKYPVSGYEDDRNMWVKLL